MNNLKEEKFDVVIIGGGASGMMAGILASENGEKVAIIEKNSTIGKKLLLTGNGRCNLTQANFSNREFVEKLGKSGKFLFSGLAIFGPRETQEFFARLELKLKTEKDGRVFPESDKAQDVLDALKKSLKKNGVVVKLNQNVLDFELENAKIVYVKTAERKIYAKNFILSTGGKSFPTTGSIGDGYAWLEKMGHTIISPAPALTPIKIKERWVKELPGVSLPNVGIKILQQDKKIFEITGEILFTHFGLSGPAVINASKYVSQNISKGEIFLELDLFPTFTQNVLEEKLKIDFEEYKKKDLKNYLAEYFSQKLALTILELSKLETDRKIYSLGKTHRNNLAKLLKNIRLSVDSLLDFESAMITSGGVSLKEVENKTMRSKIISNLFIAGEVLDLDGPTGGYNLQIAWTTGYSAGKSSSHSH
ncbi:MAG: putative flavoprotein [Candidatus Moranbacteria bacterium GW2011_GWF2_36_839]|nr:MAG: putative flavoprotein [Candidatus Moranbacteria bacterium GW2011_GWF1_36_78]KKQ17508.1 MAG: putative flavoprotein [Candidatus Moranbacteria bacterium GW2011_GWF2_36_839]HAT73971.1 aminoacetone oxidase family FAD-binding enzyme [Candidatus Moranbacteria bacterium]HBY10503.1 aminoacetone oxidase family FAD-binding enzyme [Candidatus Moranbacteria bacterium]